MSKTKIEYLTHTWNPLAMRCTPVSEGCAHCWHLRMAERLAGNPALPAEVREAHAGRSAPVLVHSRMCEPDGLKEPAVIGVQFMGDLFHEDVPHQAVRSIFQTIGRNWQQTFCILTKRPWAMQQFIHHLMREMDFFDDNWRGPSPVLNDRFPNLWLGVSAENRQRADGRIPVLLDTPAAVRFVSVEPMLGPVSLVGPHMDGETVLDWVICGAETGPGKRPMELDWARGLRDQCVEAGAPFFFKRDGAGNHELDGVLWEQEPERSVGE